MKERASIKFANWSKTKEEWYKKECDNILYKRKSEIILDGDLVFTLTDNHKILLLKITNTKTKWFEIWLKLNDDTA